jgi:ABC-2 type transport system ATP-binding protein
MEYSIEVKHLVKKYRDVNALDDISFNVKKGEIFSLLGPNGAGKTTTINILTTLTQQTSGIAKVGGIDVLKDPVAVKAKIGWVSADIILDEDLTAMENLHLQARLQATKDWKTKARGLLKTFGILESANKRISKFSTGMRKKVEIAMALISDPEIIFMDEPTIGLDVATRQMLWDLIRDVNKNHGKTILLTTHYMEEADELTDRIAIINKGKIIAIGTPTELKNKVGGTILDMELLPSFDKKSIKKSKSISKIEFRDDHAIITVKKDSDAVDILKKFDLKKIKTFKLTKPSLDTAFMKLTGSSINQDTDTDYRKLYSIIRNNTRR